MGNCGGKDPDANPEALARSRQIETQIMNDKKTERSTYKLLLLGSGESGKTTVAKQMRILYLNGFTPAEVERFKFIIHSNILMAMRNLLRGAMSLGVDVLPENAERARSLIDDQVLTELTLSPQLAEAAKVLWTDPGVQEAYKQRNKFQLIDSAPYFFNELTRIASPEFVPTTTDILYARARTSGILETVFVANKSTFRLVDVGGQRSERKKWMHCFENVSALLFVVAISEYDQKLAETDQVNRMHESVMLFDEICKCQWFTRTPIILFLNKDDLFREKIQTIDLNVCFPNYKGGCHYENASKFIQERFQALARVQKKEIYPHFTTSTNTENIRLIFAAVQEIVCNQMLSSLN
ncbi:MAG: guanine nucleotide-binding protein subunit alpha [archaeon]|nr:guanine nucleotide-binding protein subunit alpha [archaeon]